MSRIGRSIRLLVAVAAALVPVAVCGGSEPVDSHATSSVLRAQRLIHLFDFEEKVEVGKLGHYEKLPMGWYAMGRPDPSSDPNFLAQPLHQLLMRRAGFSRHSVVQFDGRQKTSGEFSLFLGLNDCNNGAFLEVGALPVIHGSDYQITAQVRTTDLKHARVRVTAYFVDDKGHRIDRSVVQTDRFQGHGQWRPVVIKLSGEEPAAAWIGLELELIQPDFDKDAALGKYQIVYQEVSGGAWFDDIAVWQLPHVEVRTQSPVNVIRAPHRPRLAMQVRDLTGQLLVAEVTIYDHRMEPVVVARRNVGAGEPTDWAWVPPLPGFGWYLVQMNVHGRDGREVKSALGQEGITHGRMAFLWLGQEDRHDRRQLQRFVLLADSVPHRQLQMLPQLMESAGLYGAVISCWDRSTQINTLKHRIALLDEVLHRLQDEQRRVTLSLGPVPGQLGEAINVDPHLPVSMFDESLDSSWWREFLVPITLRYGQHVRRWQLGNSRYADPFNQAREAQFYPNLERAFKSLTLSPTIILPWSTKIGRRPDQPKRSMLAMNVPQAIRPDQIDAAIRPWTGDLLNSLRLDLEMAPATMLAQKRRVEDLTLRMLYGWEASPHSLALHKPWTRSAENRRTTLMPDPLLGVFSTVGNRLAGRKVVGRFQPEPGLQTMILDGPRGGLLAAWNQSALPCEAYLKMYLGLDPWVVDVWGNRREPSFVDGRHEVVLGRTPLFVEHIDARLALFRAGFVVDRPFLESAQRTFQRSIRIQNPWSHPIAGQMRIIGPKNWTIRPRVKVFSIGAGEALDMPIAMRFPVSETAGAKKLVAHFEFSAETQYDVDVWAPMEVGLEYLEFGASLMRKHNESTGAIDAVVTHMITNKDDRPISLFAFSRLQGYERKEAIVTALQPGQTKIRCFTFADATEMLSKYDVRVGIREINGPAALNKILKTE